MKNVKFASIIVTYRCNARCQMCNTWNFPTEPGKEIGVSVYEKLPDIKTINVTGGEPFLRTDLDEIITVLKRKTQRIVISSNGFFTEKIINLFRKHKDIGIRVSLEGEAKVNDEIRGIPNGFDSGMRTITALRELGIKDIGFGITMCDRNAKDMMSLYSRAKEMNLEFATAAVHNSFYFHKFDNKFERPDIAAEEINKLIDEQLKSRNVKDWFRAYFNYGLTNYIEGKPRLLPCNMGHDSFFLDPYGEIFPCNVMGESMGNLRDKPFEEIWSGEKAGLIRDMVKNCKKNCWMVGSASQQMIRYVWKPIIWILRQKLARNKKV